MKDILLTLRIEKEMNEKLKKLAEASRRTLSDYVRLVLESAVQAKTKV